MNLLKELEGANTIGITGHIRPDGDCIGSVMGTYLFLKKVMPQATIIPMIEKPADEFGCIAHIDEIKSDFNPDIEVFDAFIGLDSSTTDRYGEAEKFFKAAKKTIVIDHHISNEGFGDAQYIDGMASSASELVYDVIDKSYMDADIALALYIGIIHDTGVLHYSCTSPKTLRTVADLTEFGFDFSDIIDKTFYEKTMVQNRLLGEGLLDFGLYENDRIAVVCMSIELMDKYGADSHDLDGIVNQIRYTKGVEVAVLLYEKAPNEYKISFRSKGLVDLSVIATHFEGGGHARAAGCTLYGEYDECVANVIEEIRKQL